MFRPGDRKQSSAVFQRLLCPPRAERRMVRYKYFTITLEIAFYSARPHIGKEESIAFLFISTQLQYSNVDRDRDGVHHSCQGLRTALPQSTSISDTMILIADVLTHGFSCRKLYNKGNPQSVKIKRQPQYKSREVF